MDREWGLYEPYGDRGICAMRVKSIKFYVPTAENGKIVNSAKGTYIAVGEAPGGKGRIQSVSYDVTPGPGGLLEVVQTTDEGETKRFIYQLADILGRIEVTE
jgi:hypothetical protein